MSHGLPVISTGLPIMSHSLPIMTHGMLMPCPSCLTLMTHGRPAQCSCHAMHAQGGAVHRCLQDLWSELHADPQLTRDMVGLLAPQDLMRSPDFVEGVERAVELARWAIFSVTPPSLARVGGHRHKCLDRENGGSGDSLVGLVTVCALVPCPPPPLSTPQGHSFGSRQGGPI